MLSMSLDTVKALLILGYKAIKQTTVRDIAIVALLLSLLVPVYILYKITEIVSDPAKLSHYIEFRDKGSKTRYIRNVDRCLLVDAIDMQGQAQKTLILVVSKNTGIYLTVNSNNVTDEALTVDCEILKKLKNTPN